MANAYYRLGHLERLRNWDGVGNGQGMYNACVRWLNHCIKKGVLKVVNENLKCQQNIFTF